MHPGVDIMSTVLTSTYRTESGTSMAAPHVAGIAALILSVRPDLTETQVRDAIELTCRKLSGYSFNVNNPNGTWNSQLGYGLVDTNAAVYSIAPRISGPDVIGASCIGVYTLSNPPTGSGVTNAGWQYGSGLEYVSGTGTNTYTVRRSSNLNDPASSFVRYQFTFNGQIYAVTKPIIARIQPVIAAGVVDLATHNAVAVAQTGRPYYFKSLIPNNQRPFVQYYEWELTMGGGVYEFSGETTEDDPITFSDPGTYLLRLRIRDGCGWSEWVSTYVNVQ